MSEICLIIATAGRAELLGRTLESLAQCELPTHFSRVIVIENGDKCGTESICQRPFGHLNVQYLWSPVANKSHALNVAMQPIDDSTLIVFGDDDIRYSPGTLMAYANAAANAPSGTFFGGPFGCDYETPPPSWIKRYLPVSAVGWQPSLDTFSSTSDRFIGFNWAAVCGDIKRLGGFDPQFGPGSPTGATGQETNMQRRMHAAGMHGQLVEDAWVYHYVPRNRCSIDWTVERARRNGVSRGIAHQTRPRMDVALSHWSNLVRLLTSTTTRYLTSVAPDSRLHFQSRYRQQKAIGYFKGYQAQNDNQSRSAA